jgi:hypothetical protein
MRKLNLETTYAFRNRIDRIVIRVRNSAASRLSGFSLNSQLTRRSSVASHSEPAFHQFRSST